MARRESGFSLLIKLLLWPFLKLLELVFPASSDEAKDSKQKKEENSLPRILEIPLMIILAPFCLIFPWLGAVFIIVLSVGLWLIGMLTVGRLLEDAGTVWQLLGGIAYFATLPPYIDICKRVMKWYETHIYK